MNCFAFLALDVQTNERFAVKTLNDILHSPRFMREVSLLLFFFAALSFLVGVLLIEGWNSEPEIVGVAVGSMLQALLYVVLGVLIRKGSVKALWIAGVLFLLDTAFQFLQPSGMGLGTAIVNRAILIYVLIRYIRRERISA